MKQNLLTRIDQLLDRTIHDALNDLADQLELEPDPLRLRRAFARGLRPDPLVLERRPH